MISVKVAKEYLHVRDWLTRANEIVDAGEAANRLDRAGVAAPQGHAWADAVSNRNWLIHQYDQIDRAVTWSTLTTSLPAWAKSLQPAFKEAVALLAADG